jgi:hypothetical protein
MGMLEGMETADDIPQEVLDRESRLKRLVEQFGTLEGFMTQEELQRLREEPLIERQPKAKNGPLISGKPSRTSRPTSNARLR